MKLYNYNHWRTNLKNLILPLFDDRKDNKKSTKRNGFFWNILIYYKKGGLLKLEVQCLINCLPLKCHSHSNSWKLEHKPQIVIKRFGLCMTKLRLNNLLMLCKIKRLLNGGYSQLFDPHRQLFWIDKLFSYIQIILNLNSKMSH